MNENQWEQVKKNHSKRVLLILLLLISIAIVFSTIFFNNKDILSNNASIKKNSSFNADSGLVDFSTPDSDIDHFFGSADTSKKLNHIYSYEKNSKSDSSTDGNKKTATLIQKKNHNDTANVRKYSEKTDLGILETSTQVAKNSTVLKADSGKVSQKFDNIESSNWYSFVLPNVESTVSDRKDIIIRLALELFYNDSTETREILLKRDALRVVARKVIQRKELNSIRKEILSNEFENEMNMIFDKKTLQKVIVREFHIEKVDVQ
jgi:hypothetical protein